MKIELRARVSGSWSTRISSPWRATSGATIAPVDDTWGRSLPISPLSTASRCKNSRIRTAKAAAQFHALGLCREVLFYRPVRRRDAERAIWDSHRAVAQDAIAKGFARILVLEDDVLFIRPRETVVRRTTAALRALPSTWWGLYLGHVPIQAYFLRLNLLRVRSGCTHAYIANAPLLAWLASTPPMSAEVAMSHWIGPSIDAAMSSLPEMYAMFPMIAVQRYLGESGADTRFEDQRQRSTFLDVGRWRYFFIYGAGARFAEAMAALFSRVHRLTLEWACRRVNRLTRRTAQARKPGGTLRRP
jgi:hypothetical protein